MSPAAVFIRRYRVANFILGTSGLFWVPCILVSLSFFYNDSHCKLAMRAPSTGTSLAADYREAAATLKRSEPFECWTLQHRIVAAGDSFDPRDAVLAAIEQAESAASNRAGLIYPNRFLEIIYWVDHLDLAVLRKGYKVRQLYNEASTAMSLLNMKEIRPYCEQQDLRRLREEALLPPLEVTAAVRAQLTLAAEHMEEAVAAYAEVRPWLLLFFYAWIAYSVVGLASAFYLIRLTREFREAVRAEREEAGLPPW